MAIQLFNLPPELILRILCFLDLPDLSLLQQTHSTFRHLIQDSQGLQYRLAATLAEVESNVYSTYAVSERLALLKNREQGWLLMDVDFQKSIPNVKYPSGIYDLTGGIYFRGDLSKKSIHYCQLPSRSSDTAHWKTIKVDKALVDIGVSVYEHNLIAILTYSPHPMMPSRRIIEIVLLELSTGKPHPLAKNSTLFIDETQASKPAILLEIVGEYLVLVMTREFNVPDTLHVYEWKTGTLKMNIERPHCTYHDFIFLSPTLILLPNYRMNTLDVWELPTGTKPPATEPFLSLALPSLSSGSLIFSFSCRCEPNPTPGGTPHSQAPFHPDPDHAIIVLNARMQGPDGVGAYSLYVHRSDLLKVCTTDRPEDEDGVSHYIPSTFTVERIPGKRARAWADWGPPITRVFDTSRASLRWITTTIGQRALVRLDSPEDTDDEDEDGLYSQLLDFNPSTVKRVVRDMKNGTSEFDPSALEMKPTTTIIAGIEHPIISQLPYVGVDIPFQASWFNHFEGLLLYEEGLLVLLTQDDGDVGDEEKIEVLHFGVSA